MKFLDGEPTEGMLQVALNQRLLDTLINCPEKAAIRKLWQVMYDAIPESAIGMEPVCTLYKWVDDSNFDMLTDSTPDNRDSKEVLVYSAYQLATLQSENERLRKENTVLDTLCKYRANDVASLHAEVEALKSRWIDYDTDEVKSLTAERDKLIEALTDVKEVFLNKFVWKGTSEQNKGVSRCCGEILPIIDEALSKYEGVET